MKFIIIGIGKFGKNYIKTLKKIDKAKIVGLCSRQKSSFDNLEEELKIAPWFNNYKDIIENTDCDSVIIATHPDSHFEIAKFALENNKNVICEKPCMFSEEEFRIIENLSKNKNLIFYTDYINLFQPVISEIKYFIKNNFNWHWIDIINIGNGPIREKYTALWDYGSHILSVILHLFNAEDIGINSVNFDANGNYYVLFSYKDKRIYTIFGNKASERINKINLISAENSIRWEDDRKNEPLKIMLEKFIDYKLNSNYNLSIKISKILKTIHEQ